MQQNKKKTKREREEIGKKANDFYIASIKKIYNKTIDILLKYIDDLSRNSVFFEP